MVVAARNAATRAEHHPDRVNAIAELVTWPTCPAWACGQVAKWGPDLGSTWHYKRQGDGKQMKQIEVFREALRRAVAGDDEFPMMMCERRTDVRERNGQCLERQCLELATHLVSPARIQRSSLRTPRTGLFARPSAHVAS